MSVRKKLDDIVFRNYANKTVVQGDHKAKITDFFQVLIDAARKEFTEDNDPTLDSFLEGCFKDALKNKQRGQHE